MTSTLDLSDEFGRLVGADEDVTPRWLADHLITADGLTAITGASKTGKTTLAIECIEALRDPRGHRGSFLDAWIEHGIRRVLVIATHGQHAQYQQAFAGNSEIAIVEVPGMPAPGFWQAYQKLAISFGAELVVIDTVQSLAGAATPDNLAGLMGFECPVLAVLIGHATTPGVKDGDEYRALAISSMWVRRDPKSSEMSVAVACRWAGDRLVSPYLPKRSTSRLLPSVQAPRSTLGAAEVRSLGELARGLPHKGGGATVLAGKLLDEFRPNVTAMCGHEPATREIAQAIELFPDAWAAGLRGATRPTVPGGLADEPPF